MNAHCECRSGSFGTVVYDCEECHSLHTVPCCCGNRHCPSCQHERGDEWLRKQMKKLLPTYYFLLTITLPEQLRDVVRSHQKAAYAGISAFFITSWKVPREKICLHPQVAIACLYFYKDSLNYLHSDQ